MKGAGKTIFVRAGRIAEDAEGIKNSPVSQQSCYHNNIKEQNKIYTIISSQHMRCKTTYYFCNSKALYLKCEVQGLFLFSWFLKRTTGNHFIHVCFEFENGASLKESYFFNNNETHNQIHTELGRLPFQNERF